MFAELFQTAFVQIVDCAIWPAVLSIGFLSGITMFAIRRAPTDIISAAYAACTYFVWLNRWEFLQQIIGTIPHSTPHPQHWGALGIPVAIAIVGMAIAVVASFFTADSKIPSVETKVEAPKTASTWLSEVAALVPTSAMAAFARIRGHIEELTRLSTQLPSALPALSSAEVIVTRDLRGLLVAYQRVEIARRLLPGMTSAGDKVLTDGMERIEAALVEMRKNVADEALKTLSVEGRFLELKHGDETSEAAAGPHKDFDA